MASAWSVHSMMHATLLLLCVLPSAEASSAYLAELCRGGTCTDPRFPILDFDAERGECLCRAHPCWDDNGVSHVCAEDSGFPFLHFTYDANRTLTCSCSSMPQYDSLHVNRDKCAGEFCDSAAYPVLDFHTQWNKCFCRAHPCWDQDGRKHTCEDARWPILHYREDQGEDGTGIGRCECVAKLEKPVSKLRGASVSKESFGLCTWRNRSENQD